MSVKSIDQSQLTCGGTVGNSTHVGNGMGPFSTQNSNHMGIDK